MTYKEPEAGWTPFVEAVELNDKLEDFQLATGYDPNTVELLKEVHDVNRVTIPPEAPETEEFLFNNLRSNLEAYPRELKSPEWGSN